MKLKLRALKMGLIFALIYSAGMTASYVEPYTAPAEVLLYFALMAVVSGLLFGFAMYFAMKRQHKVARSRFPSLENKEILDEELAFRVSDSKPNAVEGWIFLTSDGLYYSSNVKRYATHSCEIPFHKIVSISFAQVKRGKNPDRLMIACSDGTEVGLRIQNVTVEWAGKINAALEQYKASHPE